MTGEAIFLSTDQQVNDLACKFDPTKLCPARVNIDSMCTPDEAEDARAEDGSRLFTPSSVVRARALHGHDKQTTVWPCVGGPEETSEGTYCPSSLLANEQRVVRLTKSVARSAIKWVLGKR
jgi:hypothetical protein